MISSRSLRTGGSCESSVLLWRVATHGKLYNTFPQKSYYRISIFFFFLLWQINGAVCKEYRHHFAIRRSVLSWLIQLAQFDIFFQLPNHALIFFQGLFLSEKKSSVIQGCESSDCNLISDFFCSSQNPIFRILMHWKAHLFRHFRLFQTFWDFSSRTLSHPLLYSKPIIF